MKNNNMNNESVTRRLVYNLSEVLRSSTPANDYLQIIIALLLIKRMDGRLIPYYSSIRNAFVHGANISDSSIKESHGGLPFYNYCGYPLSSVLEITDEIEDRFEHYINCFDQETREILHGLNFGENLSLLKKMRTLRPCLYMLRDLHDDFIFSMEDFSWLYSFLWRNGYSMEFVSPKQFGEYVSLFLFNDNCCEYKKTIYDPVCGTTLMLNSLSQLALKNNVCSEIDCYGTEVNSRIYSIVKALTILCQIENLTVSTADSLVVDPYEGVLFDYVVADLPIGLKLSEWTINDMQFRNVYPNGVSSKCSAELLFMQMMLQKLNNNGRAAIITSGSAGISSDNSIRSWLFKNDYVESIVKLPNTKDSFTNISRYMWVLSMNKSVELREKVSLIDLSLMEGYVNMNNLNPSNVFSTINNCSFKDLFYKHLSIKDLGMFRITLNNKKSGKEIEVEVPYNSSDVTKALQNRGYDTTELGSWNVRYDKILVSFKIDFESFFSEKKFKKHDSNTLFCKLANGMASVPTMLDDILNHSLPARYKGSYIDSEWAGQVPQKWQPIILNELINISTSSTKEVEKGNIPLLNVKYLRGENTAITYTSEDSKCIMVNEEDFVIIRAGANAGEVLKGKTGALSSNLFLVRLECENKVSHEFFNFLIMSMGSYIMTKATGASLKNITKQSIVSTTCYIPSLDEQNRIVKFLSPICKTIDDIHKALGVTIPKLIDFRDALVYDAVTGKLNI